MRSGSGTGFRGRPRLRGAVSWRSRSNWTRLMTSSEAVGRPVIVLRRSLPQNSGSAGTFTHSAQLAIVPGNGLDGESSGFLASPSSPACARALDQGQSSHLVNKPSADRVLLGVLYGVPKVLLVQHARMETLGPKVAGCQPRSLLIQRE